MKSLSKKIITGLVATLLTVSLSCKRFESTKSIVERECNNISSSEYKPVYKGCFEFSMYGDSSYNKGTKQVCCYVHNPGMGNVYFEDLNGDWRDEVIVGDTSNYGCPGGDDRVCYKKIYSYNGGVFLNIFGAGVQKLSVGSSKTNGYKDLELFYADGNKKTSKWNSSANRYSDPE